MASIRLDHVTKSYGGDRPAVDDVSIDVADGEFVILVGPSGCGKSTILRMIVGLLDVTSGDIYIGERRVNDLTPRDRNLAMVFQNYALYPHLPVFENIAFPLRLHNRPEAEVRERVLWAAGMLELTDLLSRKPAELSGGQRQRVAMGRAIVREADAYLFDEPLSNLDAMLRGQMRTEISRLHNRLRMTTVYVTHDQTEAMTLGDRLAVLRKGQLQQIDTPRQLYDEPANLFVARFIGSPPMNLLPAAVDGPILHLPIADVPLPPDLADQVSGREVLIAGIRPEHLEDAALVDDQRRATGISFRATIDVIEWLGSVQYAYIPFEAPADIERQLADLAQELDTEQVRTQIVASLDATSQAAEGADMELWFEPSHMHLFDPPTGDTLTHGLPVAATARA